MSSAQSPVLFIIDPDYLYAASSTCSGTRCASGLAAARGGDLGGVALGGTHECGHPTARKTDWADGRRVDPENEVRLGGSGRGYRGVAKHLGQPGWQSARPAVGLTLDSAEKRADLQPAVLEGIATNGRTSACCARLDCTDDSTVTQGCNGGPSLPKDCEVRADARGVARVVRRASVTIC
ncbi:hypothetical protein PI124_g9850 [Phytophthora idaei]|nr:hypothetical protein PI125_g9147 [Phytophthora idaei]KAG3245411.1 hypothetical protein PI124_g9850 [Phytophthora idaei]